MPHCSSQRNCTLCAAGKLADMERRVRGLDEYTHANDTGAAVADLSARVGSLESSVAHLAKVWCGGDEPWVVQRLAACFSTVLLGCLVPRQKASPGLLGASRLPHPCCVMALPWRSMTVCCALGWPPALRLQSDSGMKASLGSLQQAMGQLKTALVALELRPPLGDVAQSGAGCLQVTPRAARACPVRAWVQVLRAAGGWMCTTLLKYPPCHAQSLPPARGPMALQKCPEGSNLPWAPLAAVGGAGEGGTAARGGGHPAAARPAGSGAGLSGGGRGGRPDVPPKGAGCPGPDGAAGQHAARGRPRASGAAAC